MTKGIEIYRTKTTTRAFGSPSRYYQGKGELNMLGKYIAEFGNTAAIIIDGFLYETMRTTLEGILSNDLNVGFYSFGGECSDKEIDSFTNYAADMKAEVIVGIGGGKTLDVAKAVSHKINAKLIICPSAASTDSPTSALSVVYTDEGVHSHCYYYKTNPDIVVVDSDVIKNAPVRLLVSGMGDAIATYFEAMSNEHSDSANYIGSGYRRTKLSLAISKLCYDIITEKGIHAKIEAENHICTEILEDVIEANILLSGLGFENTGCSVAHAIASGLSVLREADGYMHGEKVAYGVLVQHIVEGYNEADIMKLLDFYLAVGLPTHLIDMNVQPTMENVLAIAEKSIVDFGPVSKLITIEDLCACILSADLYATKIKEARI
jgi:glycerol dehydrogenase